MTSPINDFPSTDWNPYPFDVGRLSRFRLVDPITSGFYGQSSGQLLISSNHRASLVNLGQLADIATLALDGGGFPVVVAVAFGLIQKSQLDHALTDQPEITERGVTLLIPQSLAATWKLQTGQIYSGNVVQVIADSFAFSDTSTKTKIPGIIIRFITALRLVLGQLLLIVLPVLVINSKSILWTIGVLLFAAFLIAGLWSIVPGSGWMKGTILGVVCAGITILPVVQIIPTLIDLPHLLPLGIFLAFVWMGGILMGARSSNF